MSADLPSELNRIKEEEEQPAYDPPYEENQGDLAPHAPPIPVAEDHDYTVTQELREPDLPDLDEERGEPVDMRGQAGEQGDDDLHGFHQGADIEKE